MSIDKSEEELFKANAALKINSITKRMFLKEDEEARFLGISQKKVKDLKRGDLEDFSVNELLSIASSLYTPGNPYKPNTP